MRPIPAGSWLEHRRGDADPCNGDMDALGNTTRPKLHKIADVGLLQGNS